MNWPLFWALALAFGFVIGNVMLVKRSAKHKMPSLKDLPNPTVPEQTLSKAGTGNAAITKTATTTIAQKPNSPE